MVERCQSAECSWVAHRAPYSKVEASGTWSQSVNRNKRKRHPINDNRHRTKESFRKTLRMMYFITE